MPTTEHTINDALAEVLRTTRHVWATEGVISSENTGVLKHASKRPDILVTEANVSPGVPILSGEHGRIKLWSVNAASWFRSVMPCPVYPARSKALREAPPQAMHHFTLADQVNLLVSAGEANPDLGFVARMMALCSLPRINPGNRFRYQRVNGPYKLIMTAQRAPDDHRFRPFFLASRVDPGRDEYGCIDDRSHVRSASRARKMLDG